MVEDDSVDKILTLISRVLVKLLDPWKVGSNGKSTVLWRLLIPLPLPLRSVVERRLFWLMGLDVLATPLLEVEEELGCELVICNYDIFENE